MKTSKLNGVQKLLSVVLIAIMLIFVIGFAASGWYEEQPPNDDTGNTVDPPSEDVNPDEDNKDGNNENHDNEQNTPPQDDEPSGDPPNEDQPIIDTEDKPNDPIYYNAITGLEITADALGVIPYGYVVDPGAPLYGISSSDICIEFPTENESTRMLSYTTDTTMLWKIGSLVETRGFISEMSCFLGGVVISYGRDDILNYGIRDTAQYEIDLSKKQGCYFLENTIYIYTSKEKSDSALDSATGICALPYKSAPYIHSEEQISGISTAYSISIPYSDKSKVELLYSEKTGRYLYYKAGMRKMDMLTGNNVGFDNVYVLFADSTTYEKAHGSELVIETLSGGSGYYATNGSSVEIHWGINELGELCFYSLSGEKLIVNTGTAYVAFYKSSLSTNVKIK